eukprot:SAG31_NODE_7368_length_1708_cov_1.981976_1_plen_109_part_00
MLPFGADLTVQAAPHDVGRGAVNAAHLRTLWGNLNGSDRARSFNRLQNLACHLMPIEAANISGDMLVPLPGTPAFSDWMRSLLEEARHQRVSSVSPRSSQMHWVLPVA